MGRQVLAGALGSATSLVVLASLGLITTPYLLVGLGGAGYGVLVTISLVCSHMSVMEFGFGAATTRQIARARAAGATADLRSVLRTSFGVFIIVGLVAGFALWAAAPLLVSEVFRVPGSLVSAARASFRLAALLLAVTLTMSFFTATLQGLGHVGLLNISRLAFGILWAVVAVGAVLLGYGLTTIVLAQLSVAALNCVALAVLTGRRLGGLPRPGLDPRLLRTMGRFGVLVLAGSMAYQWMINGPPAVLATLVSSSELTTFMIPHLALQKLAPLVAASSLVFFPAASISSATGDLSRLGALLRSHLRLSFTAAAFICAYLSVFARPLLTAWISADVGAPAARVLSPLVLSLLPLALAAPLADVARASGHPSWVLLYAGTVAVLGGWATVTLAASGLPAVAWGVFVSFIVPTIAFTLLTASRLAGLTARELLLSLRRPALAAMAVWASFAALNTLTSNVVIMLAAGLVLGLAYAAGVFHWILEDSEKRVVLGLLDRQAWCS